MLNNAQALQVSAGARFKSKSADYLALAKPGIMSTVVLTTYCGFFLASSGPVNYLLLFHTLLGTSLAAFGAGVLNMLLEIDEDALMSRTANRPLPTGRVSPEEAFFIGSILASFGVVHLSLMAGILPSFIAALSVVLYLVFYTPIKKTSPFCTMVGAVAGALPPLIGWSAAKGALGLPAFGLFAILFVWQFPHLLALAWMYREDYLRAGFKMMPVPDGEGTLTAKTSLILSILLLAVSLFPFAIGLSGIYYALSAALLGGSMVASSYLFLKRKTRSAARRLFFVSIFYIPLLLGFMVMGRWTNP